MYLSDNAKRNLKWIIVLREELGHMPSFKEYDDDPRTPRANCLAHDFGSYSEAIKRAEYFIAHPELLEIKPVAPPEPASKAKEKTKGSSKKAEVTSVQKNPPAPKAAPKPAQKPEPKAPQPILTWKTTTVATPPPAPMPKPKPKERQAPKTPPKPPKTSESQRIPEKPSEPLKTAEFTPQECQEIMDAYIKEAHKIISYYPTRVVLINEDDYLAHEDMAGIPMDIFISYYPIPRTGFYAKTKSSTAKYNSYKVKAEMISYDVAIMRNMKTPYLFRDGKSYSFPPPTPGVLLLVTQDVAEAAKLSGRTTGDLVFPTAYFEEANICFCCELGCI